MSNVVKLNTYRRENGNAFKVRVQKYYLVDLRFPLVVRTNPETFTRVYSVIRAFIDEMGGFALARGFTKEKLRSGKWHTLSYEVKSQRVLSFLKAIDQDCASGLVQIRIEGEIMGAA